MAALLARMTRKRTLSQVTHIVPVPPRGARGLVAQVYRQVERDFGMLAPPVSMHSPAPAVLAASWLLLRESLIATGAAGRPAKEAVAAAVSLANQCPYCVDVHGAALIGLLHGPDAELVAAGRLDEITDARLRALALWAYTGTGAMPYPEQLPEHLAVFAVFHYLNRMVNIFLPDSPLPANLPPQARARVKRIAARLMGMLARGRREPGTALGLLPAAPLPDDMAWAAPHPTIAAAFGRAAAAIDAAGRRTVPDPVRVLVHRVLEEGGEPDLAGGRAWLEDHVASLSEVDKPAGRLAVLTAVASHRITPEHIAGFRRRRPDDGTFVEFTAWASLAAARNRTARLARSTDLHTRGTP